MLYFRKNIRHEVLEVVTSSSYKHAAPEPGQYWAEGRWIVSYAVAEDLAEAAKKFDGKEYIVIRDGSTEWQIVAAPCVGDEASKTFNGDYYPVGKIVKIAKNMRWIQTEDGTKFYRQREGASWRAQGTWWLTSGTHSEKNPSF